MLTFDDINSRGALPAIMIGLKLAGLFIASATVPAFVALMMGIWP